MMILISLMYAKNDFSPPKNKVGLSVPRYPYYDFIISCSVVINRESFNHERC
jgi:hypothetical protein